MSIVRPDILIIDRDGNPAVAVEVKNREHLSPDIARVLRRNLVVHGYTLSTPFFLLLSQDNGYLWKNATTQQIDISPDYQFPLDNVISRYLKSEPKRRLSGEELELLIVQWLIGITLEHLEPSQEPDSTLVSAGLDTAIRGGQVIAEAAA